MTLSPEQENQEAQYDFPYHYVPRWSGENFSQVRVLPWGYEYAAYMQYVVRRVLESKTQLILDIGCGDGRFTHELRNVDPSITVEGIDYSGRAVALARAFNPESVFYHGTTTTLPTARFDTVVCIEVIEHIEPELLKDFVTELSRLLAPGGQLILTTPSIVAKKPKKHFQHFSEQALRAAFEPLQIEEIRYLCKKSPLVSIIRKALSNRFFALTNILLNKSLFRLYLRHFFMADSSNGEKVFLLARKN